jgi:2-keto-4-pentenoate hydratase/2-oxohepta-3-ene-1,7-dioic acid hydratase in catechol pathway
MRLLSFEVPTPAGTAVRLGLLAADTSVVDLNAAYRELMAATVPLDQARLIADALLPPDMLGYLDNGAFGRDAVERVQVAEFDSQINRFGQRLQYDLDEITVLSPLPRPRSIRDCSAFEEHVRNASPRGVPEQWYRHPTYYKGNTASVVGSGVPVRRPAGETRMDYELEFAVVIGTAGRDIPVESAHRHIAGYTVFNDVSCRDIQLAEMRAFLGPAKGKDFDGGNVLGPYLVTPDEFDPAAPNAMVARIDGEEWSRGRTDSIHYSVAEIISYISRDETLYPGDVIGAGTVGGGCGLELGRYPGMGQEVELKIDGLGVLRNRFVGAAESKGEEAQWVDSMAKSQ